MNGDVAVYTAGGGPPANVTWTSPIARIVNVSGAAWMMRNIGRASQWTHYHNGVLLTGNDVASDDLYDRAHPFRFADGFGGPSVLSSIPVASENVLKLKITKTTEFEDLVRVN